MSFRFGGKIHSYGEFRFIPPHQSLTRQLPPEGKPFYKISFVLHNKENHKAKPQFKVILAMFALRKKGFPLGGELSRKRLMRGDQSPPTQRLQKLTLLHQTGAKPYSAKNLTSPKTKTFPKCTRPKQSESNLRHVRAGALGESSR